MKRQIPPRLMVPIIRGILRVYFINRTVMGAPISSMAVSMTMAWNMSEPNMWVLKEIVYITRPMTVLEIDISLADIHC